ncbi:acyltransferase [Shewanella algae]|uniref:acyltransferase n=1 Tax=Shewanella algae TaxID=38313 RepID=UPI0031F49A80
MSIVRNFSRLGSICFIFLRKLKYYLISDSKQWMRGRSQPVLFKNYLSLELGDNVCFGVESSPYFFTGYGYIDCRLPTDIIRIGNNCHFNNNIVLITRGANIIIGDNCLFGINVSIVNSDFHDLDPKNRFSPVSIKSGDVEIEENVFCGNDVKILKNVRIGKNTIVAAGSVVTKDLPSNVIAAGNPAMVIKKI